MTLQILNKDHEKKVLLNLPDTTELSEVEKRYSVNAIRIFSERYLLKSNDGQIVERLDDLFRRVAVAAGIMEILYDEEFYTKHGEGMSVDHRYLEMMQEHNNEIDYKDLNTELRNIKFGSFIINPFHKERLLARYNELAQEGHMKVSFGKILDHLHFQFIQNKYIPLIQRYYDLMANAIFLPNTPTLMNAGTKLGQNAACFTLRMEDSIDGIGKTCADVMKIFKSGGGIGINYSELRPKGAFVHSTGGVSSGPISFLKIVDAITGTVAQAGKRRGASMGIMDINHEDIVEFITLKDNKTLHNHNISICANNDFFYSMLSGNPYTKDLMNMITKNAWKTGDPGMVFLENMNNNNLLKPVFKQDIAVTNPCLTGSTRLATSKGLIKMEDLYYSGQQLQVTTDNRTDSMDGKDSGIQLHNAIPVYKTSDNADVFIIKTANGNKIEATGNHKFFIQKKVGRYAKKEVSLKTVNELVVGDNLLLQSEEGYFGNKGTKELGSVIGWWQADGTSSVTMDWRKENKKKNIILDFYHQDKEVTQQFKGYVNTILPKTKSTSGIQDISIRESIGRNCQSLVSTRLGDLFDSLQIQKFRVPEIIWQGSRECVTGYLQALFTADGTVFGSLKHHDFAIRLANIHKEFLEEIQILLSNYGITSKLRSVHKAISRSMPKNDGTGEYCLYDCQECFELMIVGKSRHKFTKEIGFLLKYKQDKAELFSSTINPDKRFFDYATKIESITYKGKEAVYDTTVPNNSSFIANGIVTHNCSEISMYPYESCILASIDLSRFINEGEGRFDIEEFINVTRTVTQFLDGIIDATKYPIDEINKITKDCRRIGVGYMGLADAMAILGIPYNSKEGFLFTEYITAVMTMVSLLESQRLAVQKGPFPLWLSDDYKDNRSSLPINAIIDSDWKLKDSIESIEKYFSYRFTDNKNLYSIIKDSFVLTFNLNGFRNCSTTTIAPTGTLSMFADCSSGIEPAFSNVFTKKVTLGDFHYANKYLEKELRERGLYSKELLEKIANNGGSIQGIKEIPEDIQKVFVTAMDIHPFDHLMMQASAQKWITNGIAKTINAPKDISPKLIEYCYVLAWKMGNKGTTIYRDKCKDIQVLNNSGIDKESNLLVSDYTRSYIMNTDLPDEYKQEIFSKPKEEPPIIYSGNFQSTGTFINNNIIWSTCGFCNAQNSYQKNGSNSCFLCSACGHSIGGCN